MGKNTLPPPPPVPSGPVATSDASIAMPPPRPTPVHAAPGGVASARRPDRETGQAGTRRMGAASAADAFPAFPAGGAAFARWLIDEGKASAAERRTADGWEPLLAEFAVRPIHGHRRTQSGGNHRPNPSALR